MTYQDKYAAGNAASKKLPNSRALQELQRIKTGSTPVAPSTATTPTPTKPVVAAASTPAATQQQIADIYIFNNINICFLFPKFCCNA